MYDSTLRKIEPLYPQTYYSKFVILIASEGATDDVAYVCEVWRAVVGSPKKLAEAQLMSRNHRYSRTWEAGLVLILSVANFADVSINT